MYFIYMPDTHGETPVAQGRSLTKMMYSSLQYATKAACAESVHLVYVEKGVPRARWVIRLGQSPHLQVKPKKRK
jgi:hypothetical protein